MLSGCCILQRGYCLQLNPIAVWVLAILSAIGLKGSRSATAKILAIDSIKMNISVCVCNLPNVTAQGVVNQRLPEYL